MPMPNSLNVFAQKLKIHLASWSVHGDTVLRKYGNDPGCLLCYGNTGHLAELLTMYLNLKLLTGARWGS